MVQTKHGGLLFWLDGETPRGLRLAKRQLDFLTSALKTNCAI